MTRVDWSLGGGVSSLAEVPVIPGFDPGSGTCKLGGQFVTLFVVRGGGWGRRDVALGRRQLYGQCLIVSGVGLSSG